MSEAAKLKQDILLRLYGLCARCAGNSGGLHNCPVREISEKIKSLSGVPLLVNTEFKGLIWVK